MNNDSLDIAVPDVAPAPEFRSALLSEVLDRLGDASGTWLVLRGDDATVQRGGDVDLLVAPAELNRVASLLAAAGLAPVPSDGSSGHRFFLGFDRPAGVWLKLDVVVSLDTGGAITGADALSRAVLARAVTEAGIARPHPDDDFWLRLLHLVRGTRRRDPAVLVPFAAKAEVRGPVAGLVDELTGGCAEELLTAARDRRLESASATAVLRSATPVEGPVPGRGPLRRVVETGRRLAQRLRAAQRPTGLVIAILGPDGAGKTTLANGLIETAPLPARYVYMGVWREYPWDRHLAWLPGTRLAVRLARLSYRAAQARWHQLRGRLVVIDRFTYDALLPSPVLDWRGRLTVAVVRRIALSPQLVLVLDAPAEVMFARKGEQGIEELGRRRETYLEVARTHPHSQVIDATLSAQDVRTIASTAVLRRLSEIWALT